MKRILLLSQKDFRRKWRNPVVIIGFILFPVIFTFILNLIIGSTKKEILPRVSTLVADKDQSIFSELFLSSLKQGELNKLIDLKKVKEEEGYKLMDKGKASALLVIPEKFGEKIWNREPVEILLLKNPSEQFLPQIVEEVCDISSLLFSSLFSVFSDELHIIKNLIDKDDFPDEAVSSLSVQLKNRIGGISKYIFPPVISLKQKIIEEKEEESSISVQGYLLPAMAIMFLLFICNIIFEDTLREKEKGTLLRMSVSPMKTSDFIWSKILISAAIGILCTFFIILLGRILFAIHWGNPFLIIFTVISLNIMMAGFISFIYSFIRTERQAGAVITPIILVMSLLGGSMIPIENLPQSVLYLSKLTLNYWGIKAFHKTIMGHSSQEILPIHLGMICAGILFLALSSIFLNKNLKKGLFK